MKQEHLIYHSLKSRVPAQAVDYCYRAWLFKPFKFIITRKRSTKLGDYRYTTVDKSHTITINEDLNIYSFLVTYLHEVAHLRTTVNHGLKVKPHGEEWKFEFQVLMDPLLKEDVFPAEIFNPLRNYIQNPKASSCTDAALLKALRLFDAESKELYLSDLALGDTFKFNKRIFKKLEIKRSRALCKDLENGKKYYIPQIALIEQIGQLSIFGG
ncbi:MAG TPA: SprT-like domain-containing protein [Cytophagaceae bacterium]|jgi:hypothetical protein